MSSHQKDFVEQTTNLLNRNEDEMNEMFYLLRLFESQYNPKTDGDLAEYLNTRLSSYNNSDV